MARVKVTGYIETDDLESDHVDESDSSGLSAAGFEAVVYGQPETRYKLALSDLDDLQLEVEA